MCFAAFQGWCFCALVFLGRLIRPYLHACGLPISTSSNSCQPRKSIAANPHSERLMLLGLHEMINLYVTFLCVSGLLIIFTNIWHTSHKKLICLSFARAKLIDFNGDINLTCKAYNGRVVMEWLTETIAGIAEQEPYKSFDPRIGTVALCMLLRSWLLNFPQSR